MTINNKSERNYRGKCLGSPVTSYGGDSMSKCQEKNVNSETHGFTNLTRKLKVQRIHNGKLKDGVDTYRLLKSPKVEYHTPTC